VKYIYDDLNRLKWAKYEDGTVIEYIYDEVGNREQKVTFRVPDISVTPYSYDYGNVEIVNYSDKVFTVKNTGGVDLIIDTVTSPSSPFSVGIALPTEKLEVAGRVKAQEFITGDITFQKDGEKLWKMFEDEAGLYIENLKTGLSR
jgi:hypothetical protein